MKNFIPCLPAKKPRVTKFITPNFGLPKGNVGRGTQTIKAIVLHCVKSTIEQYDELACRDMKLKKGLVDHPSMHYVINDSGIIHQYVEDDNISWGFPELDIQPTPNFSLFNWQLTTAMPNITPDYYVINVGIASPPTAGNSCICKGKVSPLAPNGEKKLAQLLQYLCRTYGIPMDTDHIAFHQNIDVSAEDECACANKNGLVCMVEEYCERCENPSRAEFEDGILEVIYGENEFGCLTSQSLASAIESLSPVWAGISGDGIVVTPGGDKGHNPKISASLSPNQSLANGGANAISVVGGGLYVRTCTPLGIGSGYQTLTNVDGCKFRAPKPIRRNQMQQQNINTTGSTTVLFETVVYDPDGYSAQDGFTAPVSGVYDIKTMVTTEPISFVDANDYAPNFGLHLYVNGSQVSSLDQYNADGNFPLKTSNFQPDYYQVSGSTQYALNAGDKVSIVILSSNIGAEKTIGNVGYVFTWFTASYVSAL